MQFGIFGALTHLGVRAVPEVGRVGVIIFILQSRSLSFEVNCYWLFASHRGRSNLRTAYWTTILFAVRPALVLDFFFNPGKKIRINFSNISFLIAKKKHVGKKFSFLVSVLRVHYCISTLVLESDL